MRILLSLLIIMSVLHTQAQSISSSQKTLITKRTATWCPNCGTWGWDMAKGVEALNKADAVLIRAHYSGTLQSQVSIDITENFGANYQPEFYINEKLQSVGSSTWSSKVTNFAETIDENSAREAQVSFALGATFIENEITVTTSAELLNKVVGNFYLATYLLEDNVTANQSGNSSSAVHNGVLIASFTEGSFGAQMVVDSASAGVKEELEATIAVEGEAVSGRSFRVLAVLWEKDGSSYKVENIHTTVVTQSSSVQDKTTERAHATYFQKGDQLTITPNQALTLEDVSVRLLSVDGRLLFTKNLGNFQSEFAFPINKWSGQIVLLSVTSKGIPLISDKILIK